MNAPLHAWTWPGTPTTEPLDSGLINQSWEVRIDGTTVGALQRLNTKIFDRRIHHNIHAITTHLQAKGMVAPELRPTAKGELWHTDEEDGVWRVLTWVGDRTVHKLIDPANARAAGGLVAQFHAALADLDYTFQGARLGVHDTDAHMQRLRDSLDAHQSHRLFEQVAPLASEILDRWERWDGPRGLPQRIIHGDLKISNIRFSGDRALALIDLDTLASGTIDEEMGDAFRSWCNPAREDARAPSFDLALFQAGIEGYAAAKPPLTDAEWSSMVPGVIRISNELAARFARDALEESYFGWDERFGSRGEHNLIRAQNQCALAQAVIDARGNAEKIVRAARSVS